MKNTGYHGSENSYKYLPPEQCFIFCGSMW